MATHYRSSSKRIVALPSGLGVIPSYKRAEIIIILINNLIKWDFAEKSGKDGTCSPLNPSISYMYLSLVVHVSYLKSNYFWYMCLHLIPI